MQGRERKEDGDGAKGPPKEGIERATVVVVHSEGLELIFGFGVERMLIAPHFNIQNAFPLPIGILIQSTTRKHQKESALVEKNSAECNLYSMLHFLDPPTPVSHISSTGKGSNVGCVNHVVASSLKSAMVVIWNEETRKHSIYRVFQADEDQDHQSYERAMEESVMETTDAQSFFLSQISLYDTFTVNFEEALQTESQVFIHRVYVDHDEQSRASVACIAQDRIFMIVDNVLTCFSFGGKIEFQCSQVVSLVPLNVCDLWISLNEDNEVFLCEKERLLLEIRLNEANENDPSNDSSVMMMVEEDSMMDIDTSITTDIATLHMSSDSTFVVEHSDGVLRKFEIPVHSKTDKLAQHCLELILHVLPNSARTDFLIDFACVSLTDEWDRLCNLVCSLLISVKDHSETSPDPYSSLISSTLHFRLCQQMRDRKEPVDDLIDPNYFKTFPQNWKDVQAQIFQSDKGVFLEHAVQMLRLFHLYYEGLKGDVANTAKLEMLRNLLVVISKRVGATRYVSHYVYDDYKVLGLERCVREVKTNDCPQRNETPFHLFRWFVDYLEKSKDDNGAFAFWGSLDKLNAAKCLHGLGKMVELWKLLFGDFEQFNRCKVDIIQRMEKQIQSKVQRKGDVIHGCHLMKQSRRDREEEDAHTLQFLDAFRSTDNRNASIVCFVVFEWAMRDDQWNLDRFPFAVSVPLRSAFENVRSEPPKVFSARMLDILQRFDIKHQMENTKDAKSGSAKISWGDPELRELERLAGVLITNPVSHLRFREDRRLQECMKILGTWNRIVVSFPQPAGLSDHDYLLESQRKSLAHIVRMGARCIGRGMLSLAAEELTDESHNDNWQVFVPSIPRQIRVVETRSSVQIDESYNVGYLDWLEFHSGVASGLRVGRNNAPVISNSWIVYNRPADNSTPSLIYSHAGLLLGLGLNGHLSKLSFARLFDYLARAHVMTSMGLLLGISATMMGTMNSAITKLLSVHLPLLHPPASADLEVPPSLEVASLIGLGLLYKGSSHRRIAEIMLAEIDRSPTEDRNFQRESHSLAAGLALGWVALGQGVSDSSLQDLSLEDKLLRFINGGGKVTDSSPATDGYPFSENSGNQTVKSNLVKQGTHTNVNLTAPSATLALALIYLKTNNQDVANRVSVPPTLFMLSYVRPDFLLLRCLCRGLIMWDHCEPTDEWLKSHIPSDLWKYGDPTHGKERLAEEMADELPQGRDFLLAVHCRAYCITGCLMALCISRAGTQCEKTTKFVSQWLGEFGMLRADQSKSSLDAYVIETCLMNICVAVSLVKAGSGDVNLFRLFRGLSMRMSDKDVTYGSHMANGIAIGMLFLGGSRYTLSRSNDAVAALLTSLFPIFPNSPVDTLFHLQALRHLWVLAAEERCLNVIDSVHMNAIAAKVRVTLKSGQVMEEQIAPCLLPELDEIDTVTIEAQNYIAVTLKPPIPFRVFLQMNEYSLVSNLYGNVLEKERDLSLFDDWLQSAPLSAEKGWNMSLLFALEKSKLNSAILQILEQKRTEALEQSKDVLTRHYNSNSFPSDNAKLARLLCFAVACGALPPHWSDLKKVASTPISLAIASKGTLSFKICQIVCEAFKQ